MNLLFANRFAVFIAIHSHGAIKVVVLLTVVDSPLVSAYINIGDFFSAVNMTK
jgi:hypothetical protein